MKGSQVVKISRATIDVIGLEVLALIVLTRRTSELHASVTALAANSSLFYILDVNDALTRLAATS